MLDKKIIEFIWGYLNCLRYLSSNRKRLILEIIIKIKKLNHVSNTWRKEMVEKRKKPL